MISLTVHVHIHVNEEHPGPMSSERIQRLARLMRTARADEAQAHEMQLFRAKLLSSRAKMIWHDFTVAVVQAKDDLIAEAGEACEDLDVSLDPKNHNRLVIEKPISPPYLHAWLELDTAGCCIKGAFKQAPSRPGKDRQISEIPLLIELMVSPENEVYAYVGPERFPTFGDAAEWLFETLFDQSRTIRPR
jgi:hypothetical protein